MGVESLGCMMMLLQRCVDSHNVEVVSPARVLLHRHPWGPGVGQGDCRWLLLLLLAHLLLHMEFVMLCVPQLLVATCSFLCQYCVALYMMLLCL